MEVTPRTLEAAVYLFEQRRRVALTPDQKRLIEEVGLDRIEPASVEQSLKEFIGTHVETGHSQLAGAIFALGKRHDQKLRAFFVDVLRKTIDTDDDATYQVLISLENLGERIFGSHASLMEPERNHALAKSFLARCV